MLSRLINNCNKPLFLLILLIYAFAVPLCAVNAQDLVQQASSFQQQFNIPGFLPLEAIASLLTIACVLIIWVFTRTKKRKFKDYFKKIDYTYLKFKLKSQRCESELYRLHDLLKKDLNRGRIEESTYGLLNERIEDYLVEVRRQIIQELFGALPNNLLASLNQLLENKEVSDHEYESFIKILQSTAGVGASQKDAVTRYVTDWKNKDTKTLK